MVEVLNIAPVIRDLKMDKFGSGEILQVIEPAGVRSLMKATAVGMLLLERGWWARKS